MSVISDESGGKIGMAALEPQINLTLMNSVVSFIENTTNVKGISISNELLLYGGRGRNLVDFDFRYLGELLERYEERYGSDIRDIRAIAAALAVTRELLTNDLFVGRQKSTFINKIRAMSAGDIYLKGAVYKLTTVEGQNTPEYEDLENMTFSKTEDLIFILSLFDDFEIEFDFFSERLSALLGRLRTIPAINNAKIFAWLIKKLAAVLKTRRGKDMALFRALASLPVSFVKAESKPYKQLSSSGYSGEEIAYLNYTVLSYKPVSETVYADSIVGEKIAVEFAKAIINSPDTHSEGVYNLLDKTLKHYADFKIKCYGTEKILSAIEDGVNITNAATFIHLFNSISKDRAVFKFFMFDILDEKWDALFTGIEYKQYLRLFDTQLEDRDGMNKEKILEWIGKFNALTGVSYVDSFVKYDYSRKNVFALLADCGVIDIIQMFSAHNEENKVLKEGRKDKDVYSYIFDYANKLRNKKAYDFFAFLFKTYTADDIKNKFNFDFVKELYNSYNSNSRNGRSSYEYGIYIERSFLTEEEHRIVFSWLDSFMFETKASDYITFIQCVLKNEFLIKLYSQAEARRLFDTVISIDSDALGNLQEYKELLYSESELQDDKKQMELKRLAHEEQMELERQAQLRQEFENAFDGSISSIYQLFEDNMYYKDKKNMFCGFAAEVLGGSLSNHSYTLSKNELSCLLQIYSVILQRGKMGFHQMIDQLLMVKEDDAGAEDNRTDETFAAT